MIRIEIDGVSVEAKEGSSIIEVADSLSIPIPRFCYHKKLSVAANCRMCLVQVEKSAKTVPACATPIVEGMKVWTKSKEAINSQRAVMEFLLINHPLDCPICDQGGECELQDVSMQYGRDNSRYNESKRVVLDHNLGPLIATEMTRCIQCTRCVRFGDEISGERELGAVGRSEMLEITTFIEKNVNSEVSGNVIDLCPVGALTSKPFRFKARAWELDQHTGVSPHDCIGSNINFHVRNNTVMRVVPKDNENINENWISDRDRFSYEAIRHEERLRKPMLCKNDKWNIISWTEALKYTIAGLKLCIENYGADQVGVLASPSASTEEHYLLQKLMRGLGCNNIDHRLRQLDFSYQELAPLYPNFGIELNELEQQDCVLLIGSQIHKEQPIAGLKLRKMVQNGGKVCVINPVDYKFNFPVTAKSIINPHDMLMSLASVTKLLLQDNNLIDSKDMSRVLAKANPTAQDKSIAAQLSSGKKVHIILGQLALMHPQYSIIVQLSNLLAQILKGSFGCLSDGANSAGAWLAGCVPHRLPGGKHSTVIGKNSLQMLASPQKCYVLYALEPEFDTILGEMALKVIKQADFVIVFTSYQSKTLLDIADILLPIAQFSESPGTYINLNGKWQTVRAATMPFADSRPGWKVLRVLGNFAELANFQQVDVSEVLNDLQQTLPENLSQQPWQWHCPAPLERGMMNGLARISPLSLYAIDPTVRRAHALQQTKDAINNPTAQINSKTAQELKLNTGDTVTVKAGNDTVQMLIEINDQIADQSILIYQANINTNKISPLVTTVEVAKC